MSNPYREKLRSISTPRKTGKVETKVERTDTSTVIHKEHWDGSVDAVVRPDTVRHGARVHQQGRKKGEMAEVRQLTPKERKDRYGEGR